MPHGETTIDQERQYELNERIVGEINQMSGEAKRLL